MPFLNQTTTLDSLRSVSLFSLLRPARTLTREPQEVPQTAGVLAHLRQELPAGVNSLPLAAYAFMSGYLNAVSFTTAAIWCGFMTGNSVMLGLALARVSLGQRREAAYATNDAQATTALVCFVLGIGLARIGDLEFWGGPKPPAPTVAESKKPSEPELEPGPVTLDDIESGLRPPVMDQDRPRRSSADWADSGAPTRVGTPVPFAPSAKICRVVVPQGSSSVAPMERSPTDTVRVDDSPAAAAQPTSTSPAARAPARTRLWLIVGTLFQACLLVGAGLASMHDPTKNSPTPPAASIPTLTSGGSAPWSTPAGFIALGLMSLSMGIQGVMAHRMGSGFGATVVLSSLWVELVGSPGAIRWSEYRGVRVYTILLFISGGLIGAVLRDAGVLGIAKALFVGAGMRVAIALSWAVVPGAPRRRL